MAKLIDERFLFPGGLSSDGLACLDIIMAKQLPNGACHSILFKLTLAILRQESSEALRRRLYALLSYIQYCQHMLVQDVPSTVLQFLLLDDEQDGDDMDLQKINREQAELACANFSILGKEAQSILDLVLKDATEGSELGKQMALYVLDALFGVDHEKYFLSQLQSRGFLRSCLTSISNSHQVEVVDDGNEEYFDPHRRSDNNVEASREDLVEIETSSTAGLSGEASIQNPSKEWAFFMRSLMQRFPVSKTVLTYSMSDMTIGRKTHEKSSTSMHLEELEDLEKFAEKRGEVITDQEYVSWLHELKAELTHAWHADYRVTSLKLSIDVHFN